MTSAFFGTLLAAGLMMPGDVPATPVDAGRPVATVTVSGTVPVTRQQTVQVAPGR